MPETVVRRTVANHSWDGAQKLAYTLGDREVLWLRQ
jgi:hypothetical protein